jgi:hypothetical protein
MRFACWINNVSDTFRIFNILFCHGHNVSPNAPLWYVISILPVLLCLHVARHSTIAIGLPRILILNATMIYTNPSSTEVQLHFIQKFSDLVGKIIVLCCDSHKRLLSTVCGQNAEVLRVRYGNTCSYLWTL